MSNESGGGLSKEEFLVIQEQLLELRNKNYELQEQLRKKDVLLQQQSSPKNEALQFANKLINRSSRKEQNEKEIEIDLLRRKLATQEEEFRLQQSTLFEEMNLLSAENESLKTQMSSQNTLVNQPETIDKNEINDLKENIKTLQSDVEEMTERAKNSEKLTSDLEDMILIYQKRCEESEMETNKLKEEAKSMAERFENLKSEMDEAKQSKNEEERNIAVLNDEITSLQLKLTDISEKSHSLQRENEEVLSQYKKLEEENTAMKEEREKYLEDIRTKNQKIDELQTVSDKLIKDSEESNAQKEKLIAELKLNAQSVEEDKKREVENEVQSLESKYAAEIEEIKKNYESEHKSLTRKIALLEERVKSQEEEKKLALKKQTSLIKELQKSLRDEKKRADSYEKKNEEWHVVQESDGQSNHTYDGNDSISSLSAIESENVELITRLATLQKLHSENTDKILQLESENSRLRREVLEKGELIKNWIQEKPTSSQQHHANPKLEGGLRKLLSNIGQDQSMQDLREMNKKLQRMLEETLSKNIILQRDLQTLLERTEI